MNNLFKKQSAKFVQYPSSFTKVMAKHILVCFFMPHSVETEFGSRLVIMWDFNRDGQETLKFHRDETFVGHTTRHRDVKIKQS